MVLPFSLTEMLFRPRVGTLTRARLLTGNRDFERYGLVGAAPAGGDVAAHGSDGGGGVFQVAEGVRLDMDIAEAGRHGCGAVVVGAFDAGEVVVEKLVDRGPHDHAFGGADGALQAPGFPDGGGALLDHVAPAGIGGGGDEVGEDFSLSILGQGVDQAGDAGVAGVVMAVPYLDDIVDDVLDDTGLVGRGDDAEGQREEVGGL